jgi:hypothetical protein
MRVNKKKAGKIPTEISKLIKVQLDHRTLITITSMKSFQMWKDKFPDAKVVSPA